MTIPASDFPRLAIAEFPSIEPELSDDGIAGLIHLEVAELARFVQAAKGRADWATWGHAMGFVERLLSEADQALDNALYVSFLEHIDFDGPRGEEAWRLVPPSLQRAWRQINDGWGRERPGWMP